ncbi:HAD family phosphatase [Streptomyces cinnabarinus]|uniref:HAD family phosphatase n=1 Tax=Streptomyces cinnabarinus TaxID=67287 RepID=A0ABY7KSP2_9ACTN|nr:HAD family phosphatase [Streptomyces cinnabarinus]WAZ26553.1 HAD family phosphatase [Streptomyces cinnabarinus]
MITFTVAAVVFDCDGTLMDTHPCVRHAVSGMFARRDRSSSPLVHTRLASLALPAQAAILAELLDEPATALLTELEHSTIAALPRLARPMPGALDLVRRTAPRMPTAIASNSSRSLLDATLALAGLADLVPFTVAADEVAAPKPAPDLYLVACDALGVRPEQALAVEDSLTGAHAARAAGVPVLGVGPALARHRSSTDWWTPDLQGVHMVRLDRADQKGTIVRHA